MEGERPYRILIVDDQRTNLELLEEILRHREYEVLTALSGAECLEQLTSNENIDLILLDVVMPEMDGLKVCKVIKSIERLKDIPIIFSTSLKDEISQLKGFLAGAVDYITKPFNKTILYARVQAHIDLKVSRDRLHSLLSKQEQLIDDLQKALVNIEELKRLLPICPYCQKMRNDNGNWELVDTNIEKHTANTQTHRSLCPDCAKKHYIQS